MRHEYLGDLDYREDKPTECEFCGGPIHVSEGNGNVYVSGPADLKWAAQYGISEEGWYRSRWYEWQCLRDKHHSGPILHG